MKGLWIAVVLVGLPIAVVVGSRWNHAAPPSPGKPVSIIIPDSRVDDLEKRVKTLEEWCQRRGMRY